MAGSTLPVRAQNAFSWEHTHLQAIQDLTGTKDFEHGARVLVAEQNLGLVSVEPAGEGQLRAQLLPGPRAAPQRRRHPQRGPAPAQLLQLLVSEAVHPDGARVVSCRNKTAGAASCSPLRVFLHAQRDCWDIFREKPGKVVKLNQQ